MSTMVLFIDPQTGESRMVPQPFATIEELRAAEAEIAARTELAAAPDLDLLDTFFSALAVGDEPEPALERALSELSDAAFVETLYGEVLRRGADTEGADFWVQQLGAGATRADIFEAFVTSEEAISISSPEQIAMLGQHFGTAPASDMG